jgi:hypothetical protein
MDEAHPGTPLQGHIGGDALSNTRISFRYKQETKTITVRWMTNDRRWLQNPFRIQRWTT